MLKPLLLSPKGAAQAIAAGLVAMVVLRGIHHPSAVYRGSGLLLPRHDGQALWIGDDGLVARVYGPKRYGWGHVTLQRSGKDFTQVR